jgi:tetratricopeptide (TPR) repeat protein
VVPQLYRARKTEKTAGLVVLFEVAEKLPGSHQLLESINQYLRDLDTPQSDEQRIAAEISILEQGVSVLPEGHKNMVALLSQLGRLFCGRFGRLGRLTDIDQGISYYSQTVLLLPEGNPNRPGQLSSLGASYYTRFNRVGELSDINKAVEYMAQAVALAPNIPELLSNLGASYEDRFQRLGDLEDIRKAIECHTKAVSLTHPEDIGRPGHLLKLGQSHQSRFNRLGEIPDIDKAISCASQAVELTPEGHPKLAGRLIGLGLSYERRSQRLGQAADIEKALVCQIKAVSLTPIGDPNMPTWLNNLGNSFNARFQWLREQADIDRAIVCQTQSVFLAPEGHASMSTWSNNLGNSHESRFKLLGTLVDIDKAIEFQDRAVSLTSDGDMDKPPRLYNLGNSYESRFSHLGDLADIHRAIECQSQAVLLTPDGHQAKASWFNNLGVSHARRFEITGDLMDIDMAAIHFRNASLSSTGHPLLRLSASRNWAKLAKRHGVSSPLEAYERAMSLIPQVIWLGASIGRRFEYLTSDIQDLAVEASATAISLQRYDLALEWLEEGRSIIWNQILQLRTPFDELSTVDPGLAEQLKQASQELGHSSSLRPAHRIMPLDEQSSEKAGQQQRRLAEGWEELVGRARLLPGLHDFLRHRKAQDLVACAISGDVVIINVDRGRCDALVLRQGRSDVGHLPLTTFSHKKGADAQAKLALSLQSQGLLVRGFHFDRHDQCTPEDAFESILAMLWIDVAQPILEFLGYTVRVNHSQCQKLPIDNPLKQNVPAKDLPHITWCTTGPLSFLPLHAAGDYRHPESMLINLAVSSYTPSLTALTMAPPTPSTFSGLLAVGQAELPGFSALPGTVAELNQIQKQASEIRFTRLDGGKATPSAVLEGMEEHSWVHFACHATQVPTEPTRSAFHLRGGALDLAAIAKKQLKNAHMAFLSACQTATGDKNLPEEAVHLAAGMIMAGYPTVIATMWSIHDQDAPLVAESVYAYMLKEGAPESRNAAKALHEAVGKLRNEVGVKEFSRWVPYIHIGR